MYQFKVKYPETNDYAQCLGNISKYLTMNNIKRKKKKEKKRIKRNCFFSIGSNPVQANDILDIDKCLIKKT